MDSAFLIDRLAAGIPVLRHLIESVSPEQARWKPTPETWSILEIAAHLVDEEIDDFRTRVGLTLAKPAADWPPIDPQGWVADRRYAERDLQETLNTLVFERAVSVSWLRSLTEPSWSNVHAHPLGPLSAGDLLASWVAHDLLHVRQLARRHWEYAAMKSEPYTGGYAGDL